MVRYTVTNMASSSKVMRALEKCFEPTEVAQEYFEELLGKGPNDKTVWRGFFRNRLFWHIKPSGGYGNYLTTEYGPPCIVYCKPTKYFPRILKTKYRILIMKDRDRFYDFGMFRVKHNLHGKLVLEQIEEENSCEEESEEDCTTTDTEEDEYEEETTTEEESSASSISGESDVTL